MAPPASAWRFTVARLAGVLALGLVVGWMLGYLWLGVAIALALDLAGQLVNLRRLDAWLRHRNLMDPPDAGGVWGEVIAKVVSLHRRKRFHKQRAIQLLREIRRSTEALPDGVIALNARREILWMNHTAARLLGLDRRRDLGLRIDQLLRHPAVGRYLAQGDFSGAVVFQPQLGEPRFLSLQLIPYAEGDQQLMLVRDVTHQTRLEQMRRDFVANASHELRSPLTVISGYLETLCHDPAIDTELRAPLAEMRRQAERMTTIVRDLLELSRLESTEQAPPGEPIDMAALLALMRKDVLARPEHPRTVSIEADPASRLLGVEAEIHSALANLVENAAKYTPAEGSIALRWWADEAGGHVSVADTGIGIPPEHLPRITERFYRVDPGRSRATGGSGLGLSIVKHVLQRHGAQLEIRSEEGKGSTFTCHFPRERVALPAAEAEIADDREVLSKIAGRDIMP